MRTSVSRPLPGGSRVSEPALHAPQPAIKTKAIPLTLMIRSGHPSVFSFQSSAIVSTICDAGLAEVRHKDRLLTRAAL
jgi:hypothetical protein